MPRRGENLYKRRDGRWEGRYRCGTDLSGKAKYRSVYGKSYQEARQKLILLRTQPEQNHSSGKQTVRELFREWLAAIRNTVKASTFANYSMKIRKHLLPGLGALYYERLTPSAVQDFIAEKRCSGLSAKYVADIVTVLKSMAKYMKRVHGYRSPLEYVDIPKVHKCEKKIYSKEQQSALSDYLLQNLNPTAAGILLSMYAGLRIGEICGLKWQDIDFGSRTLTVRRTVQRICTEHGTRLNTDTPKSVHSQRVIPVPVPILMLLKRFACAGECYLLSGTEHLVEPRTMQNRFRSVLKKAGLPSVNYHCLRHMFATNSLQAGCDIKTLSEILGHASVDTTLRAYVHSSMERKIECMNLLMKKANLPSDFPSDENEKTV
ncbi:MAG: site-specific integrase [Oscillospiraceae bacterium]|nr:site-specific integrase [Oscillospiraceae bacterium]